MVDPPELEGKTREMEPEADQKFSMPSMIPTCREFEGALDDILRPLKAAAGIFWAMNRKPQSQEEQTIIDLCIMMEDAAHQIEYLIEHATVDGKSVAFALVDHV